MAFDTIKENKTPKSSWGDMSKTVYDPLSKNKAVAFDDEVVKKTWNQKIEWGLELDTVEGFIIPRMSTTQRDELTPVDWMIIYNKSTNQFNIRINWQWRSIFQWQWTQTIEWWITISTTTSAFIPPRMSTTQRDALSASEWMIIHNTDNNFLQLRSNGSWRWLIDNGRDQTISWVKYFWNNITPLVDNSISVWLTWARFSSVWAVNWTIQTSDEREKTEIKTSELWLDFINRLNPVSFKWKVWWNEVTYEDEEFDEEYEDEEWNKQTRKAIRKKEIITTKPGKREHYWLIAQELEAVLAGRDFGGLIIDENWGYWIRYDQLICPLIKAVKELSEKVKILENNQ